MDTVPTVLDSLLSHLASRCATGLLRRDASPSKADESLRVHSLSDVWRTLVVQSDALPLIDDVVGERYLELERIHREQDQAYSAHGLGDLVVCLGFVTLQVESDGKVEGRVAPVAMLPAQLVRREGGQDERFALLAAGGAVLDPVVARAAKAGLGVVLPQPDPGQEGGVDAYLDAIERILASAPGRDEAPSDDAQGSEDGQAQDRSWTIVREVGLSSVPGEVLAVYADLARHGARIARSPLARRFALPDDPKAPSREAARTVKLGSGGDSADARLLDGTDSFVVEAGPDDGLLGAALADVVARKVRSGRRVLVVAGEKPVRTDLLARLGESGVDGDVVDVSDGALLGTSVVDALVSSFETRGDRGARSHPVEPLHLLPGQAAERMLSLADVPVLPVTALGRAVLADIGSYEGDDLRERLGRLTSFGESLAKFDGGVEACPWYGARVEEVSHDFRAEARLRLDELNLRAKQANITYQTMERETGLSFSPTLAGLSAAAELFDQAVARPDLPSTWSLATDFDKLEALRSAWEARSAELVERVHALHDRAVEVLGETSDDAEAVLEGRDSGGEDPAELTTSEFVALLDDRGESPAHPDAAKADAPGPAAGDDETRRAPESVGEVSEHPGYIGGDDELRASTAIDRYAKLVVDTVSERMSDDPCFANWAASKFGDVRAAATRLEQFQNAAINLRGHVLRDYMDEVLGVDYEAVESRFSPEGASWFRRLFNFGHRRDMKTLAHMRRPEAGGARGYRDEDAVELLRKLRALGNVLSNTEADAPEYRSRFGALYQGEQTDLSAINAKLDAFSDLVDLRDMARDMESGIVWADLDAAGLSDEFGELYAGDAVATSWGGRVASTLEWARTFRDRAVDLGVEGFAFTRGVAQGGAGGLDEEGVDRCVRWSQRLHDTVEACTEHAAWFAGCFFDPEAVLGLPAPELAARANACVNDLRSLGSWSAYRRDLAACEELGLGDFICAAVPSVAPDRLSGAFERAFWSAWQSWASSARADELALLARVSACADDGASGVDGGSGPSEAPESSARAGEDGPVDAETNDGLGEPARPVESADADMASGEGSPAGGDAASGPTGVADAGAPSESGAAADGGEPCEPTASTSAFPVRREFSARRFVSSIPDLASRLKPCVIATPPVAAALFGEGDFMFDTVVLVEKGAHGDSAGDDRVAGSLSSLARAHQAVAIEG